MDTSEVFPAPSSMIIRTDLEGDGLTSENEGYMMVSRKRSSEDAQLPTPVDHVKRPVGNHLHFATGIASDDDVETDVDNNQLNRMDVDLEQTSIHNANNKRLSVDFRPRLLHPIASVRTKRIRNLVSSQIDAASKYPSPTSPTPPNLPSPNIKSKRSSQSQEHPFTFQSSQTATRRDPRKTSRPIKSPNAANLSKEQKDAIGIVKLDVFKVFLTQPKLLLYNRKAHWEARLKEIKAREMEVDSEPAPKPKDVSSDGSSVQTRRRKSLVSSNKGEQSPVLSSIKPVTRQSSGEMKPKLETTSSSSSIAFTKERNTEPKSGQKLQSSITCNSWEELKVFTDIIPPNETNYAVTWTKNVPLKFEQNVEGYDQLEFEEINVCQILRLPPAMYLSIKQHLLSARYQFGTFKKREAQRLCRVDVNKTGKIFDWFVARGWLENPPAGRNQGHRSDRRDDD